MMRIPEHMESSQVRQKRKTTHFQVPQELRQNLITVRSSCCALTLKKPSPR